MELPPSGWYPDPYGTPNLLRWWDGSAWTLHTHPDISGGADTSAAGTGGSGAGGSGTGASATAWQTSAQQAGSPRETAQSATVQPTTVQSAVGQVSAEQLVWVKPPSGPPTQPQPALPATAVPATTVQRAVQPTAYQAAVTGVQATTVQPSVQATTVQPSVQATTVQPSVQATTVQAGFGQQAGMGQGATGPIAGPGDASGTQVLFLGGDAWQAPGGPGGGVPGGSRYGYRAAQQRRRMWLMGLAGGTAVAVAAIAVMIAILGKSPAPAPAPAADQAPAHPPATAASPSASASPSPSASAAATTGSVLSDTQSGLTYTLLGTPWQPTCPASLNNGSFTWTAGESAIAGQVNGGQLTWYGEACSGPLPQQYGYAGVASLESTATNLASTFQSAYYNALSHNVIPEVSEPVQVSGHPAWEVTFQVTYTNAAAQEVTWADEQAAVVVADTGTGTAPAVFFTSIPATLSASEVTALIASLQLPSGLQTTVTPTATPGAGSPVPGSPAPGDGNGNGNGNGNHP